MELRDEIDKMNLWLFDNINNAVYRSSFSEVIGTFRWCEYLLCSNGQTGEKTGNKKIPVW